MIVIIKKNADIYEINIIQEKINKTGFEVN